VGGEGFRSLGNSSTLEIFPLLRALTYEAKQTLDRQGLPLVVNGVSCWVRSKEEEERIGIASDVVKMKGEDPANPGCLREVMVRRRVGDSQLWARAPLAHS